MISALVIEQILDSQSERLKDMITGLPRSIYNISSLQTHAIIITGIRRCGKSTLLQQINKSNTGGSIYLNFEDPRLSGFDMSDFNRLHDIALKHHANEYFLDEIQVVDKWENFVRFRLDEGYKVYLTGSNASLLSTDLGSKLTGRHYPVELFPFSYNEFLAFKALSPGSDSAGDYLKTGGFPEYLKTGMPDVLMHLFNDILSRDIALRFNIKNTMVLRQLAVWLVSNIGKPITGNSLRKMFQIASSSSIMEYLSYFADSYLFFYLPRFSYSAKVQLVNPKKVYCIDNGLISINSVSFSDDHGRLLENMVFLTLRRKRKELFYYLEQKECDFLVFKNGKIEKVIQVCYELNSDTMHREMDGLLDAMRFFDLSQGVIITHDQSDRFEKEDRVVVVKPFWQWATEDAD